MLLADSALVVLAFGDSLTAGYGLARHEAFPAQLQVLLRQTLPDAMVINAGVSGDTTHSALGRLPRVLSRLSQRPDLAIVELGANDLMRRVSPQITLANLDAILTELRRCNIPVLLATIDPPAFLGAMGHSYARIFTVLGERHIVRTHPFFPPGILGHHAHVLRDRLHPNAAAIDKVARAMAPVVLDMLVDRIPVPSEVR